MNRKWGTRIFLAVFAVLVLASAVRTSTPVPVSDTAINEGLLAPSSTIPHTELDRINGTGITTAHASYPKDNIPFHPVAGTNHKDLYVAIETRHIRESSYLVKDYLFFIYPSHHFW